MASRAQSTKNGQVRFTIPHEPRGHGNNRARQRWPDEPFRPSDLYGCRAPGLSHLFIYPRNASNRTKTVNTPGFALALNPHPVRRKRAHLGGAGGEPPAVLPCLLVLADKCFPMHPTVAPLWGFCFWGCCMFERLTNGARRWQDRVGVLECYHVRDSNGNSLSIVSTVHHDQEPEVYAENLRAASRWFDLIAEESRSTDEHKRDRLEKRPRG